MKKWFEKGVTGESIRDWRDNNEQYKKPMKVQVRASYAHVYCADGFHVLGLTVRGSSRCRRRMARELERFLNSLPAQ